MRHRSQWVLSQGDRECSSWRLTSLRRVMTNSSTGFCGRVGRWSHVHVVRWEDNENLALSKRRRDLVLPAHPWIVGVCAAYCVERDGVPAASRSGFVFVNLAGGEVGRALRDGGAREVVGALGRRAGIDRVVTPHQFRHGLATELVESGRSLDEVQMILGHAQVETTRRYARTSARGCATRSRACRCRVRCQEQHCEQVLARATRPVVECDGVKLQRLQLKVDMAR